MNRHGRRLQEKGSEIEGERSLKRVQGTDINGQMRLNLSCNGKSVIRFNVVHLES